MPIYEYKCLECGSHLEKMQKTSDASLTVCENCGGKLEKQWSLSGFQFKGDGWYVTDYSGKGKEPAAEKSATGEKSAKNDASEKSSPGESTVKSETASKKTNDGGDSKKDSVSKKE